MVPAVPFPQAGVPCGIQGTAGAWAEAGIKQESGEEKDMQLLLPLSPGDPGMGEALGLLLLISSWGLQGATTWGPGSVAEAESSPCSFPLRCISPTGLKL